LSHLFDQPLSLFDKQSPSEFIPPADVGELTFRVDSSDAYCTPLSE
jgi:hypothetical protein